MKLLNKCPLCDVFELIIAEEQEAGVASEGGGEDEGGEGDAVGDQDDWENPSATRANNVQLSSREFV